MQFWLFAQQMGKAVEVVEVEVTRYPAYSPDWWIDKFEKYGVGGSIALLLIYLLWRYLPRAIEAFIHYMEVTAASNVKVSEAQERLVDMAQNQDEMSRTVVSSQIASAQSANKLVELHSAMANREEAVVCRACDLVELVTQRLAPELMPEVIKHTNALRQISHKSNL